MNNDISEAFIASSRNQIEHARRKINHCFDQLQDDDIWWAPRAGSNPIGVIVQHLMGNLRQWAISGISGAADVRDRPSEFRVERKTSKSELQASLGQLLDKVSGVYSRVSAGSLLKPRRIQGFETTVLNAIYDTMCHLELHTGQILYLARLRLGEEYKESWAPKTEEEGAT